MPYLQGNVFVVCDKLCVKIGRWEWGLKEWELLEGVVGMSFKEALTFFFFFFEKLN